MQLLYCEEHKRRISPPLLLSSRRAPYKTLEPDQPRCASNALTNAGAQVRDREAREWRIPMLLLIGTGATAATCSGCLAALAGIGGPPLILMYELLRVPQARPSSSVM